MKKLFISLLLLEVFVVAHSTAQWKPTSGPVGGILFCTSTSGDTILAGTEQGVFYSSNNGASWAHIGLTDTIVLSIAVKDNIIFVGTYGGLFTSSNNGTSWVLEDSGLIVQSLIVSGNSIFAGTEGGVFRSNDNGSTWIKTNNGFASFNHVLTFAINGNVIFAGLSQGGIFQSNNNGSSWVSIDSEIKVPVYSLAVVDSNIFAGTYNGIYLSTNNGFSWALADSGIPKNEPIIFSLAVVGNIVYAGGDSGIFLTTNMGKSWVTNDSGLIMENIVSMSVIGNNVFAGTQYSGVWINQLTLGTNEVEGSNESLIFPNPASEKVTVNVQGYESNYMNGGKIQIYDMLGKFLLQQSIKGQRNDIDIKELPKGAFIIRVINNEGEAITKQLVKG